MKKEYMENNNKQSPTMHITRMVLTYGPPPTRRRQEGDQKPIKGVMHICTHARSVEGFYLMKRGKPCLEWQPLEEYLAEQRGFSKASSPA